MRNAGIWGAVLLASPLSVSMPATAADAIAAYGDFYVRSSLIAKCDAAQDAATRAFLATGDGLQRAALEEFWAEIDAVNPTHHRENRLRAEEMLQQERERRDHEIEVRIRDRGCEELRSLLRPTDHSP